LNRRAAFIAATVALFASALPLYAQRAGRVHRVGLIFGAQNEDARRFLQAFTQGMKEHSYQEGHNVALAVRHYGSDRSKIPALVDELIAWEADVLVANVSSTAAVLKKKTATIPIVMVTAVDAVAEGLVASLARPGGNVTGMTSLGPAMHAKLVDLTRELLPRAKRIAFLVNPGHSLSKSYEAAAAQAANVLALEMVTLQVSGASDIGRFTERLPMARADALVIATDAVLFGLRDAVVQAALKARLPAVALLPEFIASGAVATLGFDMVGNYRAAARYVDRILKGAKPAELPVEQPTQFELVLNLKAAKGLGLTIPQPVLVRADKVIE
jgi:putative ABC transport system substrate-binding protein